MAVPYDDELQDVVDALAERLQRSVAIDDRALRMIMASRQRSAKRGNGR